MNYDEYSASLGIRRSSLEDRARVGIETHHHQWGDGCFATAMTTQSGTGRVDWYEGSASLPELERWLDGLGFRTINIESRGGGHYSARLATAGRRTIRVPPFSLDADEQTGVLSWPGRHVVLAYARHEFRLNMRDSEHQRALASRREPFGSPSHPRRSQVDRSARIGARSASTYFYRLACAWRDVYNTMSEKWGEPTAR